MNISLSLKTGFEKYTNQLKLESNEIFLSRCDHKRDSCILLDITSQDIAVNCTVLTLINVGGGGVIIIPHRRIAFFSATEHQMNPRPVCKFEFGRCGPVEKNPATGCKPSASISNCY